MDERGFFDNLAPIWDDNEVRSTPERVRRILGLTGIKRDDRVLDLGTGTGVLLPYIAELTGPGGKITAVDYSEGMLKRAKEKFSGLSPRPEFLNIDFESDNIEGEYDHILLYCVYPHLHEPVETLKWLRSVNLAEDGKITIAFPSSEEFINSIHRERHSESDLLPSAHTLAAHLQAEGLNAEVAAADEDAYVVVVGRS